MLKQVNIFSTCFNVAPVLKPLLHFPNSCEIRAKMIVVVIGSKEIDGWSDVYYVCNV